MMDRQMLTSFTDELLKIGAAMGSSGSNIVSPFGIGKGSNTVTKPAFPKAGISKPSGKDATSKPTNYSIVNSADQPAAQGAATVGPPPPVRT